MAKPLTAGRGDPYWYEWFVGIKEVLNLLDPSTGVVSVAFQVEGIKGWDDVVVTLSSGHRRYYQVKHTRSGGTLTFGDLVRSDEQSPSLLQSLFDSWRGGDRSSPSDKWILYTNRSAGERWSTTDAGKRRPPLVTFLSWMIRAVNATTSLDLLAPPKDLTEAWGEWRNSLTSGTEAEQLTFLRALELRTDQDDLEELVTSVERKLAAILGVSAERIIPLVDSLHRALRKWTTGKASVSVEDLCCALTLEPSERELALPPPPPEPFFPSRIPIAQGLQADLASSARVPVFFLSGEPGAGKTSVLSWLSNRRTDQPLTGIVGLRFFCFEPITPAAPFIAPDASRVRPDDLWFSLLSQLRQGLNGRLSSLQVPVRNDLLTWTEARKHVLRIASALASEQQRPFVIVIDGIDHAARSAQVTPEQSKAFFASIPSPSELDNTGIRLLIAGQPSESYSQHYPVWLNGNNPLVRKIALPGIDQGDIEALCASYTGGLLPMATPAVASLIAELARGNTLAAVFAAAEASRCETMDALRARLVERRLVDGVETYYSSIWGHMLGAADPGGAIAPYLAGALAIARRGLTSEVLAEAYSNWGHPPPWWYRLLDTLRPLLIEAEDGFRVRHNDVRVFLTAQYAALDAGTKRAVARQLADYYKQPSADRLAAHLQLFTLLTMAGQERDAAHVFNVEWVIEGAALDIDTDHLEDECDVAIRALPAARDWLAVVAVACAAQTLDRIVHHRENEQRSLLPSQLPPFLPSEAFVRPLLQWTVQDLNTLAWDAQKLHDAGELPRARGLLARWLHDIDVAAIADSVASTDDDLSTDAPSQAADHARHTFVQLGRSCALVRLSLQLGGPSTNFARRAVADFQVGTISGVLESPYGDTLDELWPGELPRSAQAWRILLRGLADQERWPLVGQALRGLSRNRARLTAETRAQATWWAIRSGVAINDPSWLNPLNEQGFGLGQEVLSDYRARIPPYIDIAAAMGAHRIDLSAMDIADMVASCFAPQDSQNESAHRLMFATAAMIGRIYAASRIQSTVETLVPTKSVEQMLLALWEKPITRAAWFDCYEELWALARALAEASFALGGHYRTTVVRIAESLASRFITDGRRHGVAAIIASSGNRSLIERWVKHWIDRDGAAWSCARDAMMHAVEAMSAIAASIGMTQVASQARRRLQWFQAGYFSHKEYGFEYVHHWLYELAVRSPTAALPHAFALWHACDECKRQGGDNRLESNIRERIVAVALQCGVDKLWILIERTLPEVGTFAWHENTRGLLVDGCTAALEQGAEVRLEDARVLWSLAIGFSYWFDSGDNAALSKLAMALQNRYGPNFGNQSLNGIGVAAALSERDDAPATTSDREVPADVLTKVSRGEAISPSEAAAALRELERTPDIDPYSVISAIGTRNRGGMFWSMSDDGLSESLDTIVRVGGEDGAWWLLDAMITDYDAKESAQSYATFDNLFRIALAWGKAGDLRILENGTNAQLRMHISWTSGESLPAYPEWTVPLDDPELNWDRMAIRLLGVLLSSKSAETLEAAMRGIHHFIDARPSVLSALWNEMSTAWQLKWLLSASESLSSLHPTAVTAIRESLAARASQGELYERLQAWIVLCGLADSLNEPRPVFQIPRRPDFLEGGRLLDIPSTASGGTTYSGKYSAAASAIRRLGDAGFDTSGLSERVAALLSQGSDVVDTEPRAARRTSCSVCHSLDTDEAVGRAIASKLGGREVLESDASAMAQALLGSEDAWLQRGYPRPTGDSNRWPIDVGWSAQLSESEVEAKLRDAATSVDVPAGWHVFCAKAVFCDSKRDAVLSYWLEELDGTCLITAPVVPTCMTGRSFVWWLRSQSDLIVSETDGFVSGYFAGGHMRLHHCHFEVQPSPAWQQFEWTLDRTNHCQWLHGDEIVARYERIRGPLRSHHRGPGFRQSAVERWIISEGAMRQVELTFQLRRRHVFKVYAYEET